MNSWSNEELARLLRPQQPITTEPLKPPRANHAALTALTRPPTEEAPVEPGGDAGASPSLYAVPAGPGSSNARTVAALSQQEIDSLMRALNRGTEMRLRRQATPLELQRLVNAINAARRLELLAVEAMYGGASIHWSGSDWIFERPPREQRAA